MGRRRRQCDKAGNRREDERTVRRGVCRSKPWSSGESDLSSARVIAEIDGRKPSDPRIAREAAA